MLDIKQNLMSWSYGCTEKKKMYQVSDLKKSHPIPENSKDILIGAKLGAVFL